MRARRVGRTCLAAVVVLHLPLLIVAVGSLAATTAVAAQEPNGQVGAPDGEWRTYGGDLANTRYAALDQIDATNFNDLEVAWRFSTDNLGPRREFYFQSTPLVANGVLYSTGGTRRAVVALDAATGELLWVHRMDEGERGRTAPRRLSGRGLAYWAEGSDERIVYVTPGYQLIALNAKTGQRIGGFGREGVVDLRLENDQYIDPIDADIGLHAAPIIVKDVIVVGASHSANNPIAGVVTKSSTNVKGYVRGYDVRTGRRLWIFHTVPTADEFGVDTWLDDSWSYTGNTGAWSQMSADEELGHVYVPTESGTNDFYGGHRPGDNLFANSLVALDVETGTRDWHFQFTHHEIWDFDLPSAPILADITVDGRRIKAIAQPTKQGWVYVFDRTTGQPVWPIEERPVPQGDVPGEWYAATQPFPTKPPPFDRQGVAHDDLIDFTPEMRAEAVELVSHYRIGPIFTPPVVSRWEGPRATLMTGFSGANWPGGSLDPDTNVLYVSSSASVFPIGLVNDPTLSDMDYFGSAIAPNPNGSAADAGSAYALNVQGLPILRPPWGQITAIDLDEGEIVWQIAHGETPDNVRNHPGLAGLTIPRTGRSGTVGTLVTDTLLIAGERGVFTTPSGQRGAMLRAYDKRNGEEVGAVYMPAPQTGSPMTYVLDGRQYIVVAISGSGQSGELRAYRLPE